MSKSKKDWMESGLKILAETGVNHLTINRMTEVLGVTKGSFYHHFRSMRDFQQQLIIFWAGQYLSPPANKPMEPKSRLALLDKIMEEGYGDITGPENAIRTWAQQDEMVRSYVERVDAVRREFVLGVFMPLADGKAEARMMADILFALAIGSITAQPRIAPDRVAEMYLEFKRLYGLDRQQTRPGSELVITGRERLQVNGIRQES